ncbi:BTAD domain-containing putative transcriptional regulator [Streptomyces sp. NPDC048350]|uniref:AfsR/SARP family transcriptional regulator n=1 Tax=Streptomyces sp. NPDC048350 TaxID=3365538 RepID=UPI003713CE2F
MFVRLLGPVIVEGEASALRLASGRARTLLSLLASRHGHTVPDETLIERIWGANQPVEPMDALYTCAKRLRRSIRQVCDINPVQRRQDGYLLSRRAVTVDITGFRTGVQEARTATRIGQDHTALELLTPALELWRGTPLSEVPGHWAHMTRRTLCREYQQAQLLRAEIGLRLGHHAQLLPALWEVTSDFPGDETAAGLLMIALDQCGRQPEALAHYRRLRRRLADEIGVEPGPWLRHLHESLLCGAPLIQQVPQPGSGESRADARV